MATDKHTQPDPLERLIECAGRELCVPLCPFRRRCPGPGGVLEAGGADLLGYIAQLEAMVDGRKP